MHFMRVYFSFAQNHHPMIYDFLFTDLKKILKELKVARADIAIERLEPLSTAYTNLNYDEKAIKKAFHTFAKKHHVKETPSRAGEKAKTSIHASVKTAELSRLFEDYNILFDIFFTDIIVKTKSPAIVFDVMDPFNNSVLIESDSVQLLDVIRAKIKKHAKGRTSFLMVDHAIAKQMRER